MSADTIADGTTTNKPAGPWAIVIPVVVIALSVAFFAGYVRQNLETTFDDAYMFVRYANNLRHGYGVAWNPDGVQTYGTSSILYLGLIAFLGGVFTSADPSTLLVITSASLALIALAILSLTCAHFTISRYVRHPGLTLAAVIAPVFILSPIFRFHAVSGMDTSLSFLCNTVLILSTLWWVHRDGFYPILATILASYLTFLARPDNLIYACFFPILGVYLLSEKSQKRQLVHFALGLSLCLLADTAVKWLAFGSPLPLPFYAKSASHHAGYTGVNKWNPIIHLFDFAALVLPFAAFVALSISRHTLRLLTACLAPVAITFGYYFLVLQIMGLAARYYVPSAPFVAASGCLMLDRYLCLHRAGRIKESVKSVTIRLSAVVLAMLLVTWPEIRLWAAQRYAYAFVPNPVPVSSAIAYATRADEALPSLGWWTSIKAISRVAAELPAGTRVALSEYGLVGATAPQIHVIDPLGLHDPLFARHGFSAGAFFEREPDLIWLPYPDYTAIVASILDSEVFQERYAFFPGAFDYGLAVRKDGGHTQAILQAVQESWQVHYGSLEMDKYLAEPVSTE